MTQESLSADHIQNGLAIFPRQEHGFTVQDNGLDAVVIINQEGLVLGWNRQAEQLFGWTAEQMLGQPLADSIVPPQHREAHSLGISQFLATGAGPFLNRRVEITALHRSGLEFPVELTVLPVRSQKGYTFTAFIRDLRDRKLADERFDGVFAAQSAAMAVASVPDGRLLDVNSSFLRLVGCAKDDLLGQNLAQLEIWWRPQERARLSQLLREGMAVQGEDVQLLDGDGRVRHAVLALEQVKLDGTAWAFLLLQDVTDLKAMEQAFRNTDARYRLLARVAFNALWEHDLMTGSLLWGEGLRTLFGYAAGPEECTADWRKAQIHPDDRSRVVATMQGAIGRNEDAWSDEYRFRRRDGSYASVVDRGYIVRDGQGNAMTMVGAMTDISERKQTEEALRRQLDELSVLHAVATTSAQTTTEDELIQQTTQHISRLLYPDNFGVLLVDEAQGVLRHHASFLTSSPAAQQTDIPLGKGITGSVALAGKSRLVPDVSQAADYLALDPGMRSELCVPMKVGDRVLGVIDVESRQVGHFTEADQRLLTTLAGQLANAIDRLRTHGLERQRANQLAAINDISRTLSETLELPQIYERLARSVEQLLPDTSAIILSLYDPARELITCVYGLLGGRPLDVTTLPPWPLEPPGHGPQSETIYTRRPLIVNDFVGRLQKTLTVVEIGQQETVCSALYVPLLAKGNVVGVISVQSYTRNRFSQADADLLQLVANTAAISIENARLFEEQRRRKSELEVLRQASLHLTSSLTLRPVLEAVLAHALNLVAADDAHIFLYEEGRLQFGAALWKGVYQREAYSEPRLDGVTYAVARSGERLVISDTTNHPLYLNYGWSGALVGLPLRVGNQVRGVMNIAFEKPHEFGEEDLHVLELLADQAAVAVTNAQLFEETRARSRELDLLNRVISTAASALSQQEIMTAGCTELAHFFDLPQAALGLLNKERTSETVVAEYLAPGRPSVLGVELPVADDPALQAVLNSGEALAVDDVMSDPATETVREVMLARGTVSLLIVPVTVRGEVVGTLGLDSLTPRSFNQAEISLARTVGQELGRAIETAQLHEQLRTHAAELEERVAERTAELAAANGQLKELDRLKSKFVSDVSHELRTPLTNLGLYLYLLERAQPSKRSQYLNTLKEQTSRLSQLIENILDLSRLDTDNSRTELVPLSLNEVVEQVIDVYFPRAESAGLALIFEPDLNLPLVLGDAGQLARVATNLIANAINYTPEGYIRVQTRQNPAQWRVCLSVADTGIGIAVEDVAHLFKRFYRGQRVSQSDIPGTGLGLSIVKEIVDYHGGTIDVQSELGKGSTFDVWLVPAGQPDEVFVPTIGKTVLLVENSRATQNALRDVLEQAGYHVVTAGHGGEALELLPTIRPSVILSDVDMPGMDGFAFFEALRQRVEWAAIPFIFLTGHAEKQDILAGQKQNGFDYLIKPVVAEELLRAVNSRLSP